ncbi:MAG: hypothetical protein MUF16_26090, partial [Burkholderiaceae bacterium]|nr:hypothetical protein [Burkholderiaceae bacterium]
MAVPTVQIREVRCLVALKVRGDIRDRLRIRNPIRGLIDNAACTNAALVIVVTQMPRSNHGLVRAIRRHRCPAELERQKGKQDDDENTEHKSEFNGCWFCLGTTRVKKDCGVCSLQCTVACDGMGAIEQAKVVGEVVLLDVDVLKALLH